MTLISEYVHGVPAPVAAERMGKIRETGLDDYRLVWAGRPGPQPGPLLPHPRRPVSSWSLTTYRTAPTTFIPCGGMVENDFAQDVLRDHRMLYHIL